MRARSSFDSEEAAASVVVEFIDFVGKVEQRTKQRVLVALCMDSMSTSVQYVVDAKGEIIGAGVNAGLFDVYSTTQAKPAGAADMRSQVMAVVFTNEGALRFPLTGIHYKNKGHGSSLFAEQMHTVRGYLKSGRIE